VVTLDDAPWFVASDVMKLLYGQTTGHGHRYEILDATEALKAHPSKYGLGKGRSAMLVSESGLYKLVMRSDKPQAKDFQNWVTQTVLPSIRKDGGYVLGEEKVVSGELSEDEFIHKALAMSVAKMDRLRLERDEALEAQAAAEKQRDNNRAAADALESALPRPSKAFEASARA
jgi:prophage antirepressor-like protein